MPSRIADPTVQRANRVRAHSSAVEHLPYKQAVTGSIPVAPTSRTAGQPHNQSRQGRVVRDTCRTASGPAGCLTTTTGPRTSTF
jgi:hypothetical protein